MYLPYIYIYMYIYIVLSSVPLSWRNVASVGLPPSYHLSRVVQFRYFTYTPPPFLSALVGNRRALSDLASPPLVGMIRL